MARPEMPRAREDSRVAQKGKLPAVQGQQVILPLLPAPRLYVKLWLERLLRFILFWRDKMLASL